MVALGLTLTLNPFAVLNAGFWLSFGAVGGLILGFRGRRSKDVSNLQIMMRSQWLALLATAPLLLCWIGQFSLISMLANAALIPFMAVLIVPMVLLYLGIELVGFEWLAGYCLEILIWLMDIVLHSIEWIADLGWMIYEPLKLGAELFILSLGSLILMLPRGLVPRWIGLLLCIPVILPSENSISRSDHFRVDILDVGQGLSVIVSTADTVVVYDAGPSFSRQDSGQQVVVPTLRRLGIEKIHLLITSHGDDDHAGGVRSVKSAIPVVRAISSDVEFGKSCENGSLMFPQISIRWTSVSEKGNNTNNASCIVEIDHRYGRVLLPGDIEATSEWKKHEWFRPVQLLISPHHGSQSSSTIAFLNKVKPTWVVHSAGYKNRFNHPHEVVVRRYWHRGIKQLSTAHGGAVTFLFTKAGLEIDEARLTYRRFWYDAHSSDTAAYSL